MVASRSITRCGSSLSTALRHNPEPLLFLYPSWARRLSTTAEATLEGGGRAEYIALDNVPHSTSASERRAVHRAAHSRTPPELSIDTEAYQSPTPNCEQEQANVDEINTANAASIVERPPAKLSIRRAAGNVKSQDGAQFVAKTKLPSGWTDSRKAYVKAKREEIYARRREDTGHRGSTPRQILSDLVEGTPRRSPESYLYLSIPEKCLDRLMFDEVDNLTLIKHRTRCDTAVLRKDAGQGSRRTLMLVGPSVCTATAAALVFKIVPEARQVNMPNQIQSPRVLSFSTRAGHVPDVDGSFRTYIPKKKRETNPRPTRADRIPMPPRWTKELLYKYVKALVENQMPNHIHRQLYVRGEEHRLITMGILDDIFQNDACWDAMSVHTINDSLAYIMANGNAGLANTIFSRTRARGFQPNTETFNVMLRGASKANDLDNFGYLARLMIRMGHWADSGSWIAFLTAVDDIKASMKILEAMHDRGLLHEDGVARQIADAMAPMEYGNRLKDESFELNDFFSDMEQKLGEKWLSKSGANKLLKVAAAEAPLSHCWSILEYMTHRGVKPDVVSGNTVLVGHLRQNGLVGLKAGVMAIDKLHKEYGFDPDSTTFSTLFQTAWKLQCFATLRVIWSYACLTGKVTNKMRITVSSSLAKVLSVLPLEKIGNIRKLSHLFSFSKGAAVFVTLPAARRVLEEAEQRDMGARSNAFGDDANGARALAVRIVDMELERFKEYQPIKPNPQELMQHALRVDEEALEIAEKDESAGTRWLFEHALAVEAKRRTSEEVAYWQAASSRKSGG